MVLWSSHLTAFDDFGNGLKMLFTKSGGSFSPLCMFWTKSTMTYFPSSPRHCINSIAIWSPPVALFLGIFSIKSRISLSSMVASRIVAFSFLWFRVLVLSSSNGSPIYSNHLFSISSGSVSSSPSLFWTRA